MQHSEGSRIHKPVIAVVGPTATGKTAFAVEIAKQLNTEIISADSQLIYRKLNIGTAKPTDSEKQGVPHWMIDVVEPNEAYSASQYQAQALTHLERLWKKGQVPVVAGGTGFYIRALLESDFIPEVPPNEALRHNLLERINAEGSQSLHDLLKAKDPQRAADLHPHDRVRIIRALEIIEATGKPVPRKSLNKNHAILWFGLTYADRDLHRSKIAARVDAMLKAGWLDEVEALMQQYGENAHALQVAHGYPELVDVVKGQQSLADAQTQICINVRQYARRQRTWFQRNPEIRWFECDKHAWSDLLKWAQHDINEMGLLF